MAETGSLRCRYLYHLRAGSAQGAQVARHHHAYCQLELFSAGRATFEAAGEHDLGPGDALLLPAGCAHAIHYRSACRYTSIKFALDGRSPGEAAIPVPDSPLRRAVEAAIAACLVDDRAEPEPRPRSALEHCLAALVAWALPPPSPDAGGDPLLEAVGAILRRRGGRPLEVADLAREVGLSPSRLSARLRAATGAGAKRMIDRSRAEAAGRFLRYADHDIATIAEMLEFPDPFTFSRFFHRVMGCSPRRFRVRALTGGSGGSGGSGGG